MSITKEFVKAHMEREHKSQLEIEGCLICVAWLWAFEICEKEPVNVSDAEIADVH